MSKPLLLIILTILAAQPQRADDRSKQSVVILDQYTLQFGNMTIHLPPTMIAVHGKYRDWDVTHNGYDGGYDTDITLFESFVNHACPNGEVAIGIDLNGDWSCVPNGGKR